MAAKKLWKLSKLVPENDFETYKIFLDEFADDVNSKPHIRGTIADINYKVQRAKNSHAAIIEINLFLLITTNSDPPIDSEW